MKRVVVIGAGPAGSAAAIRLAGFRGIEVCLLEKATFPRQKPCGSALSPWALDLLDGMGVGAPIRRQAHPIRAARIAGGNGKVVELRGRLEAAILLRARFDELLAREAARRGAVLQEGTRVQGLARDRGRLVGVRTAAGAIEADAVVVCNGATSTLARAPRPGRTLHAIMGWYEGVEGIGDAVEMYFDPPLRPYYGWVFPEGAHRANIGVCYAARPGGPNAYHHFQTFLDRRLAPRLRRAERVGRLVGHPIATTQRPSALLAHGTLLAGEAARLVDPATAEGIHQALASGRLAGECLGAVLEAGLEPSADRLAVYERRVRRSVGGRLRVGGAVSRLIGTPCFDLALRFGSWRPMQAALTWALAGA